MEFSEFTSEFTDEWARQGPTTSDLARRYAMDVEDAWMRLVYVMPPAMRKDILAEVKHRRRFMGEVQAIDSVRDDLATGRWQP
jgi:NAD(P)H-flavin reductase